MPHMICDQNCIFIITLWNSLQWTVTFSAKINALKTIQTKTKHQSNITGTDHIIPFEVTSTSPEKRTSFETFPHNNYCYFLMIIFSCQTLSLPEPGSDYVGDVSVTASGRKCQNWLDQTPHKHDFGHLGNHNSCRNLDFGNDEAPLGAWCYTTDPNIRSGFIEVQWLS